MAAEFCLSDKFNGLAVFTGWIVGFYDRVADSELAGDSGGNGEYGGNVTV